MCAFLLLAVGCGGSKTSSESSTPQTLAVRKKVGRPVSATFAEGKMAWVTAGEVGVFDLETRRRTV